MIFYFALLIVLYNVFYIFDLIWFNCHVISFYFVYLILLCFILFIYIFYFIFIIYVIYLFYFILLYLRNFSRNITLRLSTCKMWQMEWLTRSCLMSFVACDCDQLGALSAECDDVTGVCECRANVTGDKCNVCLPQHYGLFTGCHYPTVTASSSSSPPPQTSLVAFVVCVLMLQTLI